MPNGLFPGLFTKKSWGSNYQIIFFYNSPFSTVIFSIKFDIIKDAKKTFGDRAFVLNGRKRAFIEINLISLS